MNASTKLFSSFLLCMLIAPSAFADCWRLPNGQVLATNSGSTPPVAGAKKVPYPPPPPPQPQAKVAPQPKPQPAAPKPDANPCSKYLGRGYCTDYIQQRLGRKPSGDAGTWPGNTSVASIRQGDVAIFNVGSYGHVAYVEQVIADKSGKPTHIRVSEMNWAPVLPGAENQKCAITSNFGKVTTRPAVPIAAVARVWRP